MSIPVKPTHADFVTEISGVDLARQLTPADRDAIEDAINRYAIVVFHDQTLTDEQQIDFARYFGPIHSSAQKARHTGIKHRIASHDIADISNLDGDGNVLAPDNKRRLDWLANRLWHTHASFRAVPGALAMLYAHVVPDEGGGTEFADLRAAYHALPAGRVRPCPYREAGRPGDLGQSLHHAARPAVRHDQGARSPARHHARRRLDARTGCVVGCCKTSRPIRRQWRPSSPISGNSQHRARCRASPSRSARCATPIPARSCERRWSVRPTAPSSTGKTNVCSSAPCSLSAAAATRWASSHCCACCAGRRTRSTICWGTPIPDTCRASRQECSMVTSRHCSRRSRISGSRISPATPCSAPPSFSPGKVASTGNA